MRQKTEFEILRRRRAQQRFLKRMSLLVLLAVAGLALFSAWDALMRIDLTTRIGDLVASLSPGPGFPVDLEEGKVKSLRAVGGDLAILTDAELAVYNAGGKQTHRVAHGFKNPVCRTSGDRVLTFDRGGKQLRVDSRSKELYTSTLNKNIFTACLSPEGSLAVAYASDQHQAIVTVYDRRFKQYPDEDGNQLGYWTWSTSNLVLDLAMGPKGRRLAVSSVDAVAGELVSTVTLLRTDKESPEAVISLPDEVIISMSLDKAGRLRLLTDRQAALYDENGKLLERMDFERQTLRHYVNRESGSLYFVLDDHGDNTQLTLWSVSENFKEKRSVPLDAPVEMMDSSGRRLYLLKDNGLFSCPEDLSEVSVLDAQDCQMIRPAENNLYGVTNEQICLLSTTPVKLDSGASGAVPPAKQDQSVSQPVTDSGEASVRTGGKGLIRDTFTVP